MNKVSLRSVGTACALALLLSASGCRHHRKTTSAPNTTDYSDNLEPLVAAKRLAFLRWPDVSDYQPLIQTFYDDRNYEIAWTRDGKPAPAALGFIQAFADAAARGLNPEDYDSSRWDDRIQMLSPKEEEAVAQFDVAMTVCVMRFISDLRIGRVNPQHFRFDINVADKKYDLAEFVSDHAVDVTDVPALLRKVQPDSEIYRRTEQALARYLDLAKQQQQQGDDPLPMVERPVLVGQPYAAAPQLRARLQLEGDLEGETEAIGSTQQPPKLLTKQLSEGVRSYQHRHGLAEDGKLTPQTVASLNVPLNERVQQLQDTLERWRWLPEPYVNPRLMVNLPEFVLRGYTPEHKLDFTMRVVVGKVMGQHQTPVFAHMMKYLIFRPYWNVPVDIARNELVPHIEANHSYLESKNFETVNAKGQHVPYTARLVAQGGVMVREKPGPKNSLGLVKFMFPNQYDIYLHSTPATELFNRTRRDFSHGCVRVQQPDELAAWLLKDQQFKNGQDWTLEEVREAMTAGPDNHQVNLKTPIPIVIFYMTAEAEEDGHVHFFDDIYGYDAELEKVLANGPPYPIKPDPIASKAKPGDTV
ncbi:L,D-transpeptidase family protein [Edaphobacter aggregans]|uniref:L,D-transpeptidase family protein n=1 Tax=Edaphobacter aggregans TaxID=570835 RepID=UPI000690D9C4|nr:L,D-transpeptidase family protein [Edaphobacter aggregans]